MQSTCGDGYKRRLSSWYDQNLVTKSGEIILRDIDSPAIRILRKNLLIWSSWVVFSPYFHTISPALPDHSIRKISLEESDILQRFFISIAWRAAASSMPEMSKVKIGADDLERMRKIITQEECLDPLVYPVSLIQLSTRGAIHNMTPLLDTKDLSEFGGDGSVEFIRIYFDGLIAHVHLTDENLRTRNRVDTSVFLGEAKHTVVVGLSYEASFQYENLLLVAAESFGPLSSYISRPLSKRKL